MMTTLLSFIQALFRGIFEILHVLTDLNMEEVLTNLTLFLIMRVKTVRYQMEMVVFSNVLTIFSRKILAWSISNSYNQIKEEQMLLLNVGFPKNANDMNYILGYMILK